MKKSIVFIGGILLIIGGMFAFIGPDKLSKAVVGVMAITMMLGFVFGIVPLLQYIGAFRQGLRNLDEVKKVNSDNLWIPISQISPFFDQKALDDIFSAYVSRSMEQREQGVVISDIESVLNEDSIAVRSWRGVVLQVAGTLTTLGLLGTFLGLVTGISGVTFGTLQETVTGIENMLQGITTAFFTSIVGVILSIVFNAVYRIIWNMTMRELQLFVERFHLDVQPQAEELIMAKQYLNSEQMLGYLASIRDMGTKIVNASSKAEAQEQSVMMELLAGVKRGEITFSLETVCQLADRTVLKAVVHLRWAHHQLGIISPAVYMPVILSNGYIVRLNAFIWDRACATLRSWHVSGRHPAPLILQISKTDILSSDIAGIITGLIEKYQLAPRDLELSLDYEAYTACRDEAVRVENELLQKGFKVSIYGFKGDFITLDKIRADEVKLDLTSLSEDADVSNIFEQAVKLHANLSACGIDSAKQLSDVRKYGCTVGQGRHLYKQMTRKEYESLMNYN